MYLVENGADISIQNKYGFTPLYKAVMRRSLDIFQYLVSRGADYNWKDSFYVFHIIFLGN